MAKKKEEKAKVATADEHNMELIRSLPPVGLACGLRSYAPGKNPKRSEPCDGQLRKFGEHKIHLLSQALLEVRVICDKCGSQQTIYKRPQ